jgi:hypothetical protein
MTIDPHYGIPTSTTPRPSADVVAWRRSRLARAGFGEELAGALAEERDVDLHALLDLVDRGCPPALAARIMGSQAAGVGADVRG